MRQMKSATPWLLLLVIFLCTFLYFFFAPTAAPAGDIVEYYGTSESLINHGGVNLTPQDQENVSKSLNPGYFKDSQYYIKGVDGQRYPVHFIGYSLLLIPFRLILRLLQSDEIKTFALTNIVFFTAIVAYILKQYIKKPFKQTLFIICMFLSPFLSFLIWPGADIVYLSLIVLATFAFFHKEYMRACLFASIASMQAAPLATMAVLFALWALYKESEIKEIHNEETTLKINIKTVLKLSCIALIVLAPFAYNYFIFGSPSPWFLLTNGWTTKYGVGLQNVSIQKTFELLFDLNIGIFWYAPFLFIVGGLYIFKQVVYKNKDMLFMIFALFLTLLSYQTNPAWSNGTASYGPGRYSMFLLGLFIYAVLQIKKRTLIYFFIVAFISTQFFLLSLNEDYIALSITPKDGTLLTFIHPGGNTQIDSWVGYPKPISTQSCIINESPVLYATRSTICKEPGAQIQAEGITWKTTSIPSFFNQLVSPLDKIRGIDMCESIKKLLIRDTIPQGHIILCTQNQDWGFLRPHFPNTAYHSYIAQIVLNTIPQWYNPTPEIFIDRTNHTDNDFLSTAIYKNNNECKKVYMLPGDKELVVKECRYIPKVYTNQIINPDGAYVDYP